MFQAFWAFTMRGACVYLRVFGTMNRKPPKYLAGGTFCGTTSDNSRIRDAVIRKCKDVVRNSFMIT